MTAPTFAQPVNTADRYAAELVSVIRAIADHHPRSRQHAVGPSEIGEPCLRRLAYRMLDWPKTNTGSDPWKPTVGTAVHAWLAAAFTAQNVLTGRERWLVETRVQVTPAISGSADLFDVDTATVTDWKVVGETSMNNYRRNGPSDRYRVQAHLYGKGFVNAGRNVDRVAICFLPQSGYLGGAHVWTEDYDETVADAALTRMERLLITLDSLDVEAVAANWALVVASPAHHCTWCPYFVPGSVDLSVGCPGTTNPVAVPAGTTSPTAA